jgi:flavin-dependent dehydrogenase
MIADSFDTIIVGARCAGAPLAVHLARGGQRVLLLDAGKLPSDQPISTHFVGPLGVDWLDELGVGAEVRKISPASYRTRLDLDGSPLDISFSRGRAGHCIRRMHLDRLLQEAAVRAGATLRDRTKVVGLLRENGRVVGVEAVEGHESAEGGGQEKPTKRRLEFRARLVVGADGRHSTVAELAHAKEYLAYDSPRFGYWGYFPTPPGWANKATHPYDAYIGFSQDGKIRLVFQTDSNLLLVGVTPLLSEHPSWKGRHEEAFLEAMRSSPITASLVEGNRREGKLVGVLSNRFFFREAAGPGFALVGDAGLHKDPTPGYGITDALRDARRLGAAILADGDRLEGRECPGAIRTPTDQDAALTRYWRQRDLDSVDLFHFAKGLGDPSYLNPLNRLIYERAPGSPEVMARLVAQTEREISPYEVLSPRKVLRWVLAAALRGNFGVVAPFFAVGRRAAEIQRVREAFQDRARKMDAVGATAG